MLLHLTVTGESIRVHVSDRKLWLNSGPRQKV